MTEGWLMADPQSFSQYFKIAAKTVPADTARDALGLMMAGTPAEQALDPQEQTR